MKTVMLGRALILVGSALALFGCAPAVVGRTLKIDADGCAPPATHVEISEEEWRIATARSVDLIAARLDYRRETRLLSIMSRASNHLVTKAYLACRAIVTSKIPPENRGQRSWVYRKYEFLATGPTAEQLLEWDRANPLPPGRPYSLGAERPMAQSALAEYRTLHDMATLYPRMSGDADDPAERLAPRGARFSFVAAFDNAYQIQMAGSMNDIVGESVASGLRELPPNIAKPGGIYEVPREQMVEGTDYRYVGGLIHGPMVIPVRWANLEGWKGAYDATNANPILGYFIGGAMHMSEEGRGLGDSIRMSYSFVAGVGASKADADDMLVANANDRYAGAYYLGFGLGFGKNLLATLVVGQDHVFGDGGDEWKFQNKSWIGLAVGWNFGG